MKIIDTHSHIYEEEFDEDIELVVERSRSAGVEYILLPNVDESSINRLKSLSERYSGYCLPMMGLHPTSVGKDWKEQLETISKMFDNTKYIAVGEIGLDFYWDKTYKIEQIHVFKEQLNWSINFSLPVSIHSRNASPDVFKCIKSVGSKNLCGVFHSFGGNTDDLRTISQLGDFMIGVNGVVTFKNSSLPSVLKETDLSHIVIETDAPYLTPTPYRGKRNEPSYTTYIVEKLAEIYNTTPQYVAEVTTQNAKRMFNI
jgi:TatD DNase family protein